MYSSLKWISKVMLLGLGVAGFASTASAQYARVSTLQRSLLPAPAADEARDIFNAGLQAYDQSRFTQAEVKFREVFTRFPKNAIADRADYYYIRTLIQTGKRNEALRRINGFEQQHPGSTWIPDVQEAKMQLTNQVPPRAEYILLRQTPPAPPAPPAAPRAPGAPAPPAPPSPFSADINAIVRTSINAGLEGLTAGISALSMRFGEPQSADPELSLKQEVMRTVFRNEPDRAITIQEELLKSNPADPLVLSTLNMLATSQSPKALPMLLEIAKNSSNPKARKDAIFWIGRSGGDKDAVVDALTGLLPSANADDAEAVAFALGQVRTDKAINALAGIARDKNRTEGMRTSAVQGIGQSRVPNRVALLEDIYKNSSDSLPIRRQVLSALGQARDPQAVALLGNIASSDTSIELRKQAVLSLGQIKSPEASQALENLLLKK